MIDHNVRTPNLLGTIVLPACCLRARDFSIPMSEFCIRFPISRTMTKEEELKINESLLSFLGGIEAAKGTLLQVTQQREAARATSSGYVERLGPTVDCVMRFLDDLYENKTLEALSALEGVPVEALWIETDEDVNVRRVERWNVCKAKFGDSYETMKRSLRQAFPTSNNTAIYKKCGNCGCVYVKPIGCDFGTHCGQSAGGRDIIPFTYEYDEGRRAFQIVERSGRGHFEQRALSFRESFSDMMKRTHKWFFASDPEWDPANESKPGDGGFQRGCGQPVKWDTMPPLTLEELQHYGLIPEEVPYDVTPPEKAGADLNVNQKLMKLMATYDVEDRGQPIGDKVQMMHDRVGTPHDKRTGPILSQLQYLYDNTFGEE